MIDLRSEKTKREHKQLVHNLNKKEIYVIETNPFAISGKAWYQFISFADATRIRIENPELNVRLATDEEKKHLGAIQAPEENIWEQVRQGKI